MLSSVEYEEKLYNLEHSFFTLTSMEAKDSSCTLQRFGSDLVDAQSDLSMMCAYINLLLLI